MIIFDIILDTDEKDKGIVNVKVQPSQEFGEKVLNIIKEIINENIPLKYNDENINFLESEISDRIKNFLAMEHGYFDNIIKLKK